MTRRDSQTILLVEDEGLVAFEERAVLERNGFIVVVASTGEAAVEIAADRTDIDLILMDIDLGDGIDGTRAAELILARSDAPLVFLSSHTDPDVVRRTEGITSYGYIVKHTGETVLLASIAMAFRLYDARQRELAAERARRESDDELERYFAASLDMLCISSHDGRFLRLNPQWERELGYPLSELEGCDFMQFVHPDDHERTRYALAQLNARREVFRFENRYRCADGSYRWLEWGSTPIGERIYAAAHDVTARRRADDELRALESRHRALLNAIPDLMFVLSRDGVYLDYHTPEGRDLLVPPDRFLGRHVADTLPEPLASDTQRVIERVVATDQPQSYEYSIDVEGGDTKFYESRVVPAGDEILSIIRNITERRRRDEALRVAEERLNLITDAAPVGIVITDADDRLVYHNRRYVELFGYTRDDVANGEQWLARAYPDPEQLAEWRRTWRVAVTRAVKTGEEVPPMEAPVTCKDGSVKEIEFRFRTVGGRSVVVYTDVTERKAGERRIRRLVDERELLFHESHHRMKNNMAIIRSLLSLRADAQRDDDCSSALRQAAGAVQSMAVLYDRLHALEQNAELSSTDYFEPLVTEIVGLFADAGQLRTRIDVDDVALPASILSPIGIILNELVTNSIKHAFPDGRSGTIAISLTATDAAAELRYTDDGVGLPSSMLPTADAATFGLQLIASLVDQIDGSLSVGDGPGASYAIRFPLASDRARP